MDRHFGFGGRMLIASLLAAILSSLAADAAALAQNPSWLAAGTPKLPKIGDRDVFNGDVRITATIDGSDLVRIYRDRAEWRHGSDKWPTDVKINGVEWSPKETPRLDNAGATAFMSDFTVLVGATHWKIRGRSPVNFTVRTDHLELRFTDPAPGADKYEIVIHQGEVFPEIEVSEADAKKIAGLFATAPQTAHPSGKEPGARPDLKTVWREWRRNRLTLDYEKHGRRDPKWDDAARAFLDDAVPYPDQTPADKMLAAGARLIDAGCSDPLVCFVYGYQLLRVDRVADAERFLLHSVLEFEKLNYPKRASRVAPALLARLYMQQSTDRSELAYALVQRSLEEAVEAARGPFTGNERRALLAELRYAVDREKQGLLADQEPALLRMLYDTVDADPWIVHMLISDYQDRQGWAARGGGYANTVSNDGWQLFHTLLAQAKAHRVAAWAGQPMYPEAATGMIMVARAVGGVGEETPRFWFDQAVAAQFDAEMAHQRMMWALRPRWRGGHAEMLDFGMECLRTGRFDTEVPEFFFWAAYGIYEENGDLPSLIALLGADDEIRRGIHAIETAQTGERRTAFATRNLIFAWLLGWHDDVRRGLTELNGNFHAEVERSWNVTGKLIQHDMEFPAQSSADAPVVESIGTLFEKRGTIDWLDVAPNGEHVAVKNYKKNKQLLTIWNVATGQPKEIVPEKPMKLYSFRFSPDSSWIAGLQYQFSSENRADENATGVVTLWETKTGTARYANPEGFKPLNSFAWLPQGRYLALGIPHRALIFDTETNNVVASTGVLEEWVTALIVSPMEPLLVVGCESGMLKIFRLPTAQELGGARQSLEISHVADLKRHVGQIDHFAFASDGKWLASSGRVDRAVWLWDLEARQSQRRVQGYHMAFSPDGAKLATAGGPTLRQEAVVWNAKTGEALMRCSYPGAGMLVGAAFTADGEFLLAPSDEGSIFTWKVGDQ